MNNPFQSYSTTLTQVDWTIREIKITCLIVEIRDETCDYKHFEESDLLLPLFDIFDLKMN